MLNWYSYADSGEKVTYINWREMVGDLHISHTGGLSGSYLGHSGNTKLHYTSSQMKTWTDSLYITNLSDADDIGSWNPSAFDNSGLMYDQGTGKWVPGQFGGGGGGGGSTDWSDITIDASKNMQFKNLTNVQGLEISGSITVQKDSVADIGTDSMRFANVYADDLWGNAHYQDIFFAETWCDICGETFIKGEPIILIVKNVTDEMASVPIHLKCALEKLNG